MENLQETFNNLLRNTDAKFQRYIYDEINWDNRMISLTGARGVGKTTLILQRIKTLARNKSLYVTAEDFYFAKNKLLDLAEDFVKYGGEYLFVDEIHKYPNWSQELKLIYDYFPSLKIVFTGSSVLDINKGAFDLSRRSVNYHLQGLSFREYLKLFHNIALPKYTLEEVLAHKPSLPEGFRPLLYFKEYLKNGYYPFAQEQDFYLKLQQVINQTIEIDIPLYANLNISTALKLKKLLAIIAKSVPFKLNATSLARQLECSRNSIFDYAIYLEKSGLLSLLSGDIGGLNSLSKIDKVYLENTSLSYVLAQENIDIGNLRETFFLNQTKLHNKVYSAQSGDFLIDEKTFEIAGKNKKQKQIKNIPNSYVVKDDIELGYLNVIPLWHFGLLY